MVDIVNPSKRSAMMSCIRAKNTKPELLVRRHLHGLGFRYALHRRDLPGRPDVVMPKYRVAVFVHGCFWHAHRGCRYAATPATRREFWIEKFARNRARDEMAVQALQDENWRVAVVWECAITGAQSSELWKLSEFIQSQQRYVEIPWANQ